MYACCQEDQKDTIKSQYFRKLHSQTKCILVPTSLTPAKGSRVRIMFWATTSLPSLIHLTAHQTLHGQHNAFRF